MKGSVRYLYFSQLFAEKVIFFPFFFFQVSSMPNVVLKLTIPGLRVAYSND